MTPIVHGEIPSPNDLYSIPRDDGMFDKAITPEQKEWLLLAIQQQIAMMSPKTMIAVGKQVYDQMLQEVEQNVSIGDLDNYINTLVLLGKQEARVFFDELMKKPEVLANSGLLARLSQVL